MGNTAAKSEVLTPALRDSLLEEYYALHGVSERTHTGGWSHMELIWLLTVFWQRCSALEVEKSKEEDSSHTDTTPTKKKEGKVKKKIEKRIEENRRERKHSHNQINNLFVTREDAIQYIVVFNQPFVNYPSLTERIWSVVDPMGLGFCTFMGYARFLYTITRGSWEERMSLAFRLFCTPGASVVTKDSVIELVSQVGEFLGNVARGVLSVQEFKRLKLRNLSDIFKVPQATLTEAQFIELSTQYQELISCYEILDMVFGRVARKLESSLKVPCVFKRHLQETALGNAKDISGGMPFVPEVVASSIDFLQRYDGLKTEGLFRVAVALNWQNEFREKLNSGTTLRSLLQPYTTNPTEDVHLLLANLIKTYCRDLTEPLFTVQGSRQMIAVQTSSLAEPQKLKEYEKIIGTLPIPNRFFLSTLLPFLKRTAAAVDQNKMSSENLGLMFAPCTMYDPSDPNWGSHASPKAFSLLIDHAENFVVYRNVPRVPVRPGAVQSDVVKRLEAQVEKLKLERDQLQLQLQRK